MAITGTSVETNVACDESVLTLALALKSKEKEK